MDKHTEQKIGVVGGGLMGHGIAYLFAAVGHHVNVFEPFPDVRNSLPQRLRAIVELLGEDPRLLTRIAAHDSLDSAMRGADWVFEAAPEKLPLKQQIFAAIEKLVAPTTILASNSSAISSTEIGRHLTHRERMVGTHFCDRRIWCRWSKSFKTKRPAVMSWSEPCNCCTEPEKCRCMSAATSRDLSATAFSTR